MSQQIRVKSVATLLIHLQQALPDWSRSKLKDRLRRGCVTVNDVVQRQHDHALQPGDAVAVLAINMGTAREPSGPAGARRSFAPGPARGRLVTVYADRDYIAIDKPAGLLSVATTHEHRDTALARLRESRGRRARIWPVHRLDRETSGVLLFATSSAACEAIKANWTGAEKVYYAVVHGRVGVDSGVVDTPLWEDGARFVHTGTDAPANARHARTRFSVLERRGDRSLLEVRLDTGRKHQIRVHLASLGHTVVGDTRYGEPDLRLALHALQLSVTHPTSGERLELRAELPDIFGRLLP